jgi:Uma2 family endonuclease
MVNLSTDPQSALIYPDSDGQPMADNTTQFRWIVTIKENLDLLFAENPDVFVAGDLLWYPVEGSPTIRQAPDVMVAFDRPKGDRGSYMQWREGNIAPQVVFEILSPGNRLAEMAKKFRFYEQYGVEEYYIYDPDRIDLNGWIRSNKTLEIIESVDDWVSPRLGIRFVLQTNTLMLYHPNGDSFKSYQQLNDLRREAQQQAEQERERAEEERQRAKQERQWAEQERQRADAEQQRAESERQRAELLAARLRELGIEP